jgi:CheY-like chemotaxis protein
MARLLLVDDNPSIHKIAETLLSSTKIELVCVESGAEALRRVQGGEHFDVALVDTAMIGMDGWTLLARLREIPATARIPIAMMAGVLDSVDPGRLESAPIQGFLKKPVELRELGARIEKLLATPVPEPVPENPAGTDTLDLTLPDEGLLVLEADDLWDEPQAVPELPPAAAAVEEESLDLEELDLESLREIPEEAPPVHAVLEESPSMEVLPMEAPASPARMEDPWSQDAWEKTPVSPLAPQEEPFLVTADELPDLGELVEAAEAPTITLDSPHHDRAASLEGHLEPELDLSLEEELDLPALAAAPAPAPEAAAPAPGHGAAYAAGGIGLAAAAGLAAFALHDGGGPAAPAPAAEPAASPVLAAPAAPAASSVPAAPAASAGFPAPSPAAFGHPLVDEILGNPAALDALARALAARLGDKALRELAWEVMPELADRLKR